MAPENERAIEQDVDPKKQAAGIEPHDELSDKEVEEVAGGVQPIDY
jgi:hypothetical protein